MSAHTIRYQPDGPTLAEYLNSRAFIIGMRGPVGGGKSVCSCIKIAKHAIEQAPSTDGIRRSRWAIVRNTYPELKSTTIKTWLDWFPEEVFGKVKWDAPITHIVRFADVELEVLFLAMDKPDDIKKLLSLEVTGVWLNEARELPKDILDAATSRVGRYPPAKDRPESVAPTDWPTYSGVIMDTNSPDDRHWWYKMAEEPDMEQLGKLEAELRAQGALKDDQPLQQFFAQPSGLSPQAENTKWLPPGYYTRQCAGKSDEWIRVYVRNEYGAVVTGRRVYTEYNDNIHVAKQALKPIPGVPLILGFDFGLTPSCIIGQLSPRGQLRVIEEIVAEDMAIEQLCENLLLPKLEHDYQGFDLSSWGDPAGVGRSQNDERTAFDILREHGIDTEPTETNAFIPRRDAVAWFMTRMVDGEPAFLLSPTCAVLRKGFIGGYHYPRLRVVSLEDTYAQLPAKNSYSHPHDALQYLCQGARSGALKGFGALSRRRARRSTAVRANVSAVGY